MSSAVRTQDAVSRRAGSVTARTTAVTPQTSPKKSAVCFQKPNNKLSYPLLLVVFFIYIKFHFLFMFYIVICLLSVNKFRMFDPCVSLALWQMRELVSRTSSAARTTAASRAAGSVTMTTTAETTPMRRNVVSVSVACSRL